VISKHTIGYIIFYAFVPSSKNYYCVSINPLMNTNILVHSASDVLHGV